MFEKIENFRDLAEYECAYGKPTKGVIYRSGSPYYADEKELALLKGLGIKTIIDLRGERIRKHSPHPFLNDPDIKVIDIEVPHGENFAHEEEGVPDWYLNFVSDPYTSRLFFHSVLYAQKPLMIHCEAGKDRTGTFAALLLLANGVSKEDICHDYLLSYDGRLKKTEERTKAHVPGLEDFVFHPNPKTFATFIDRFLDKYGSMEEYFEAMGIGEDEARSIGNILGVPERSAGAVVFQDGKVLVEHMAKGHYSMPKGHVEKEDKDLIDTAKREIKEETGLKVSIDDRFQERSVYSPKDGHIKEVTWFIANVEGGNLEPQLNEVQQCFFLSPADAMRVLSHDDDRRILAAACAYLRK